MIGYHPPIYQLKRDREYDKDNGFLDCIMRAHEKNGAEAIQIWTNNPKSYFGKLHPKTVTGPIRKYVKEKGIFLISHSPYILNFARDPDPKVLNRYVVDLKNIHAMGGVGSVLHMGFNVKDIKKSHKEACETMVENIKLVCEKTPPDSIIILENLAGKGSAMCCKMKEWADFCNDHLYKDKELRRRVRWCVDTAHLHGVGEYDLSFRREVDRFYDDFERLIGWDKILCFHYNGSCADLGSCKDLHFDIAPEVCGKIQSKGMRHLARYARDSNKPLIMEIPGVIPVDFQVLLVRSWTSIPR